MKARTKCNRQQALWNEDFAAAAVRECTELLPLSCNPPAACNGCRSASLHGARVRQAEAAQASQAKRDAIERSRTMAAAGAMSKRDADNARVEAAQRRMRVQHAVHAERSRSAELWQHAPS